MSDETLREALAALVDRVSNDAGSMDPFGDRWVLLYDLRALLAEHPATPAEVERAHADGCLTEHTWEESDCNCRITPPAEPDAGDVGEGLSLWFHREFAKCVHPSNIQSQCEAWASQLLASAWLADRERKAEQQGAEKALREAADAVWDESGVQWGRDDYRHWLRARADRIGSDA